MSRHSDLIRYLALSRGGKPGWYQAYEATVIPENFRNNDAYKCGHYQSLLADVVRMVGLASVEALAYAHDSIDASIIRAAQEGGRDGNA
jgi:hypothetical protein